MSSIRDATSTDWTRYGGPRVVSRRPDDRLLAGAQRTVCHGGAVQGIPLERVDVGGAPAFVDSARPLVIVLLEDVYAFDPEQFDALAKSVGAVVVTLPGEEVGESQLESRLLAAVAEALTR